MFHISGPSYEGKSFCKVLQYRRVELDHIEMPSYEWKSTCIVLQYGIDEFLFLILLLMLFINKTVLLAVKHTYFQEMFGIKN